MTPAHPTSVTVQLHPDSAHTRGAGMGGEREGGCGAGGPLVLWTEVGVGPRPRRWERRGRLRGCHSADITRRYEISMD